METIPKINLEVDERGRQVNRDCLSVPTILRRILEQLSTKDLIKLSRVNKLWNYEARSVIRKRGGLTANIGRDFKDETCQKLIAFASDIRQMRVVPFSGIIVDMHHNSDDQPVPEASLESSYKVILDRLAWKRFSVNFCARWDDCKDCPARELVKKILEEYCGVLEELTLGYGKEEFLGNLLQDRSLPCLKTLKIDKGNYSKVGGPLTSAFIKALVSRAPNLQDLHVKGELHFSENVLEGSSAVLIPTCVFRPLLDPICKSLISSVRADAMEIRIQNEHTDEEKLNSFIPKLLEASRTTLKTFSMDLLFALPLMCYGIRLENVTKLQIHMNGGTLDYIEPHVMDIIKKFNFTEVFPKLTQVTILDDYDDEFSTDVVSAFVESGNEIARWTRSRGRAFRIKLIKFDHFYSLTESTLSHLAQIFPHVETLHTINTPEFLFGELCEHFQRLQEVIE